LAPISLLPWALGFAGVIYGVTAVICGAIFIALAVQLSRSREGDRRPAHRLFVFSIFYLSALFAALLINSSTDQSPFSWRGVRTGDEILHAESPLHPAGPAWSFRAVTADEA